MDRNKIKYTVLFALIALLVLTPVLYVSFDKDIIQDATIEELVEIEGIGTIIAERIIIYSMAFPDATVEDLRAVKGISDKRIKQLKRKYR